MADGEYEEPGAQIVRKLLSANGTRRRMTMQQFVLQYVRATLGQEWPSFFFLFAGIKFMHAKCNNNLLYG